MCTDLGFMIVSLCGKIEYTRESIEVIPIALTSVYSLGARAMTLKITFLHMVFTPKNEVGLKWYKE